MDKRHFVFLFTILALGLWLQSRQIRVQALAAAGATAGASDGVSSDAQAKSFGVAIEDTQSSAAPPASKLTLEQEAYCDLMKFNVDVELGGRLKIHVHPYELDEDDQPGFSIFVQSSECPRGLFSKIRIDRLGKVKDLQECRTAKPEMIFFMSAAQGNVVDRPSNQLEFNLAINGTGFFVADCGDEMRFTRGGNFRRVEDQVFSGACPVLSRSGLPFIWNGEEVDEKGCKPDGDCIAVVDPDPMQITTIGAATFVARDESAIQSFIPSFFTIFKDSVEDLVSSPFGPMGPVWDSIGEFHPPASCVKK